LDLYHLPPGGELTEVKSASDRKYADLVPDQAALSGMFARVQDRDLELWRVYREQTTPE
jgi:hypothetical protein